jgi:hypothetical protein
MDTDPKKNSKKPLTFYSPSIPTTMEKTGVSIHTHYPKEDRVGLFHTNWDIGDVLLIGEEKTCAVEEFIKDMVS